MRFKIHLGPILPPPPGSGGHFEPKGSRHVAFMELPPKHHSDYERSSDSSEHNPHCFACGMRTFMCIFVFFLLLLVIGAIFISFLYAGLPRVQIRRFEFSKLNISEKISNTSNSTSTSGKVHLTADTDILMVFRNRNGISKLKYGSFSVKVSWQDIKLGRTEIAAFTQDKNNSTTFSLRTRVEEQEVDLEDLNELKTELENENAVFHLALRGDLGFNFGSLNVHGLPTSINCNPKKQQIDLARRPRCRVRLFPV
ncbi:hypothetical protein FEM48_Zijuj02G0118100 [Ziziphus jujuba var. spinosa]|uniref:Late embryogenesis abundant protein LEA-2 subgroup domain-containing protein n=1 Tax=Ziziphus jujuba var. spinosa TaxID=714518 RepID=A0A978VVJ9_ZIZJJ|nr:hypothetical protein FEM48_Zijuj02G0118100 [Ziziphus jujuba var. spinosa]